MLRAPQPPVLLVLQQSCALKPSALARCGKERNRGVTYWTDGADQRIFFVASATADSRVNVSPKGLDSLRVIDERTVSITLDRPRAYFLVELSSASVMCPTSVMFIT